MFFGYTLNGYNMQNYFSSLSTLNFYRDCTTGDPGVTSSFATGTHGEYEIAAVYLRHG